MFYQASFLRLTKNIIVKEQLWTYCATKYVKSRPGVNQIWILKKFQRPLENLKLQNCSQINIMYKPTTFKQFTPPSLTKSPFWHQRRMLHQ